MRCSRNIRHVALCALIVLAQVFVFGCAQNDPEAFKNRFQRPGLASINWRSMQEPAKSIAPTAITQKTTTPKPEENIDSPASKDHENLDKQIAEAKAKLAALNSQEQVPDVPAEEPEAPATEKPRVDSPRLWQQGNRWVFDAKRRPLEDRIDQAAQYDLYFTVELTESTPGEATTNATTNRKGGIWKPQELTLKVDKNCILRKLKSGDWQRRFCREGSTEVSLPIMGKEITTYKFVRDNTTTYFSYDLGIVQREFDLKSGRKVTETLVGYAFQSEQRGEYNKEPFMCDWNRKRLMSKHGTQAFENDDATEYSAKEKVVLDGPLDTSTAMSISTKLKANSRYRTVFVQTDYEKTTITFVDRRGNIQERNTYNGQGQFLKSSYDKATKKDTIAVGIIENDAEDFVAILFEITPDEHNRAIVRTSLETESDHDVYLMADTEKCFFRLARKLDNQILVADLEVNWSSQQAKRTRGTVEIRSER